MYVFHLCTWKFHRSRLTVFLPFILFAFFYFFLLTSTILQILLSIIPFFRFVFLCLSLCLFLFSSIRISNWFISRDNIFLYHCYPLAMLANIWGTVRFTLKSTLQCFSAIQNRLFLLYSRFLFICCAWGLELKWKNPQLDSKQCHHT